MKGAVAVTNENKIEPTSDKAESNISRMAEKSHIWEAFVAGVNSFTDDIFQQGREQGSEQERNWYK